MGTTRLFDLVDTFVTEWNALFASDVQVVDGYALGQDYRNFVMVGVEDPDSTLPGQSGSAQQTFGPMGARSRDEAGEVVCAAVATRGDSDLSACRADCKVLVDIVENWVRNVDVNSLDLTYIGFGSDLQLLQDQTNQGGAVVTLIFRVMYKARI